MIPSIKVCVSIVSALVIDVHDTYDNVTFVMVYDNMVIVPVVCV